MTIQIQISDELWEYLNKEVRFSLCWKKWMGLKGGLPLMPYLKPERVSEHTNRTQCQKK